MSGIVMDLDLLIKITVPIATAIIGALIRDYIEKRPKLVSFIGNISSFNVRIDDPNNPILQIGTHVTVIRNAGKKSANNITIGHRYLPDYKIFPPIQHEEREVQGSGKEIFIPRLVPGEEITISYLYKAPTTATDIIGPVKSDDGFTKVLNVMLTPQWPKWVQRTVWALVFIGIIASVYTLIILGIFLLEFTS